MTKHSNDISKEDRQFLTDNGFVEGQPHTIPENLSPVLKSKLLQEMGYPGDGSSPNAGDLNPTDGSSADRMTNEERLNNQTPEQQADLKRSKDGQQSALAKEDDKGKKQDTTKAKK